MKAVTQMTRSCQRQETLERLRRQVRALESPARPWGGVRTGPALPDGLARGCVYEAAPTAYFDGPAAAGLALGLAALAMAQASGGAFVLLGPGGEEFGMPYAPGLQRLGVDPGRLLFARARTAAEAFAALEEAAHTPGLSAVMGCAPKRVEEIGRAHV